MGIQARLVITLAAASAAFAACDATQSSKQDDGGVDDAADDTGGVDDAADDSGGGEGSSDGGPGSDGPGDSSAGGEGGEIEIDPESLVDDLEDGDAVIYARNGRQGAWYTYNDETAGAVQTPEAMTSFAPTEGGAPTSPLFMARTDGAGFATWGFGMGVDLNNEGDDMGGPGLRMVWDGSAHSGLAFRARGDVAIRLKVLTEAIVPMAGGGTCAEMCEDAHGKLVPLTGEWTQYQIGFDELFQEGWGFAEVEFDAATMMSIQFQVAKNTDGMVEVDEIGFY